MNTLKIGTFPGRVEEFVVENGTTVEAALLMAGLSVGAEQDVKLDGEVVSMASTVDGGRMLLLTKRIKGAR